MKIKLLMAFLLLAIISFAQTPLNIIPWPNEIETSSEKVQIPQSGFIQNNEIVFNDAVEYLQIQLLDKHGLTWQKSNNSGFVSFQKDENLADEEYTLEINEVSAKIKAKDTAGALYGVATLLQTLQSRQLPFVKIKDKPAYAWRGFMLDESRHFFGKEKVLQLLDWMVFYKLNKFHWHLTDEPAWRLEIQRYPLLAKVGGIGSYTNPYTPVRYYSQKEIEEIVNYAKARNIEVIPEIDMPGHATAANRAYPEYSGGGTEAHPNFTFHPAKEETYQFLTNILKEVNILFPAQKLHLGGDEVSFGSDAWNKDEKIQALKNKMKFSTNKEVEGYFMQRMADSVFALESKLVVWDEMVDSGLPTDKTIMMWWRHDKPEQIKKSLQNGFSTVICPRIPLYFDFVQNENHKYGRTWDKKFSALDQIYSYDLGTYANLQKRPNQILGAQANLWTERIHNTERFDFMTFPRIAALAELVWTKNENKNYADFTNRLKQHNIWYKADGIYAASDEHKEPLVEIPSGKFSGKD